ncbi:hypothetical protein ES703_71867 [subsurface metagenome]
MAVLPGSYFFIPEKELAWGRMKKEILITIMAILAITGLETLALIKGVNGALFGLVITIIAGLAGYNVKELMRRTTIKKNGGKNDKQ